MSSFEYKEVDFAEYCRNCKYADVEDTKDPCNTCLDIPARRHSRIPEYYIEKNRKLDLKDY